MGNCVTIWEIPEQTSLFGKYGEKYMKVTKSAGYAVHALMYMVRHSTQLPVTAVTVARAEGIPPQYLAKIFQQLAKAHFVKAIRGRKKGYVFARPPEQITLLELLEAIEGGPLFDDCFLRHCECGGTPDNCRVFSMWTDAVRQIKKELEDTTIASATWAHPEHRFMSLRESLAGAEKRQGTISAAAASAAKVPDVS
jgi:Rrf2 family protein